MITYITCVTNNKGYIPDISNYISDNRNFICYYDSDNSYNPSLGWNFIKLEKEKFPEISHFYDNPRFLQRYVKTHMHMLHPESDFICWVDPRFIFKSDYFFKYIEDCIRLNDFDFLIKMHPIRKTLSDDFVWAYTTGKLKKEQCYKLIDNMIYFEFDFSKHFSPLLTIFVVSQSKESKLISQRWFENILKCYPNDWHGLRDQIVFPYSLSDQSIIKLINWYEFGNYDIFLSNLNVEVPILNTGAPNGIDWRFEIADFLVKIQNKTGSTIHSPMFGEPIV